MQVPPTATTSTQRSSRQLEEERTIPPGVISTHSSLPFAKRMSAGSWEKNGLCSKQMGPWKRDQVSSTFPFQHCLVSQMPRSLLGEVDDCYSRLFVQEESRGSHSPQRSLGRLHFFSTYHGWISFLLWSFRRLSWIEKVKYPYTYRLLHSL